MPVFLARMFSSQKWRPAADLGAGEISADAVTTDLRTTGNGLSFWRCGDGTMDELENVVIAIAVQRHTIERMDLVWIDEKTLLGDGIALDITPGETRFEAMRGQHRDAVRLDYVRLGAIARRVAAAVADERHHRFAKSHVAEILAREVQDGLIDRDQLTDGLRNAVDAQWRA